MICSEQAAPLPGMTFSKGVIKVGVMLLSALALQLPAHAQGVPDITPALRQALGNLPMGIKSELKGMVGSLKKTSCGSNLTGCYMAQSGPLQLYFFTSGKAQQTLLLVVDKTMPLPQLFGEKVQRVMGKTSLSTPIISLSTTDYELDQIKMPTALQKVVRDKYFNINTLAFSSGVQIAARADLGGAIKQTLESMGVNAAELMMRAAVVMPIPADLAGAAGTGAGVADALAHGTTMQQAGADAIKPEAFVEFQFPPNASVQFGLPQMNLTDATFFLNNELVFGYKGNAFFRGASNKKVVTHFQTPLTPAGAMDLLDFEFRMSTPADFTMEDAASVMVAMASPDRRLKNYGGGFIREIESFKDPLIAMAAPLSAIKLINPTPAPEYRFGDSRYPFPTDNRYFNLVVLSPTTEGGPLMKAAGNVSVLGQTMGSLVASAGAGGMRSEIGRALSLKLGPLGIVRFETQHTTAVGIGLREMILKGNYAGQKVEVRMLGVTPVAGMSSSARQPGTAEGTLEIEVNATCANPFEIKTSTKLQSSTDLAKVFESQGGITVDPAKIPGCVGEQLQAAYNKIANEYKNTTGYTAKMAKDELNKIANAAEKAEKEIADAAEKAQKEYDSIKNTARDKAEKSTSDVNKAFNDAGNAIKSLGKKKKHKKAPDPKLAASVFDWDYYYDQDPGLAKGGWDLATHWRDHGFNEGRQGSPEFSATFYWNRYLDIQSMCGKTDRLCAVTHWVDHGIRQGRQGSPNFSLESYMNRFPKLHQDLGKNNFEGALDHWFTEGEDRGLNARPRSTADIKISGPTIVGGNGANSWSDEETCNGQHVIGWRIFHGDKIGRVQFRYPSGWAPAQGGKKEGGEVNLESGEYVVRVDYRNGSEVDRLSFTTNRGRTFGPYGGMGGSPGTYEVTPGEKLGCMQGRSGDRLNQLTLSSTGPR